MLISVIVRSMGRPHLRDALASLCDQDYAPLEVIVVDATGGAHPPLPDLPWRAGHDVRMVATGQPLLRPHAANAGLLAVRGEWFCFLDDDDRYDPDFVSSMVREAIRQRPRLLVYGSARLIDEDGSTTREFGIPFNRALLYCGPLFYWQAALIHRDVIALGCRFDESLPVCEDRDFLAQIAEHSDFAMVPVTATNYGLTTGTSGTTVGSNRRPERHIPYESRLRAKWAGPALYHGRRAAAHCREAVATYFRGDVDGARRQFEAVLADYPDDPNALHGVGRILFEQGRLERAEKLARRAIEIAPAAAEYHWTLANILRARGNLPAAREQALAAANDANFHEAANALLRELPPTPPSPPLLAPVPAVNAAASAPVGRLALCPCGSGRRFKACHGSSAQQSPGGSATTAAQRAITAARHRLEAGEASAALSLLAALQPHGVNVAAPSMLAGAIYLECGELATAQQWFTRALEIDPDCAAGALMNQCADMQNADVFAASVYREVAALGERLAAGVPAVAGDATIHILATLANVGGSEQHALNLFRVLAQTLPVQLWSDAAPKPGFVGADAVRVIDAASGHFPRTGTLVLVGQYFDPGDWFVQTRFHRVVIRNNLDAPQALLERVADFELTGKRFALQFNYPSEHFRQRVGLPGYVERALTDLDVFSPTDRPATPRGAPLVVGRHSRDVPLKHHPNDPAFFRDVARRGHRVRLMGATVIANAIARGAPEPAIEFVPFGSVSAAQFLAGLDCFLYRAHPHWYETGGNALAEAMAMQLPVVVFGGPVGFAEVIEHGVNGFLVTTEAEALTVLEELAASPALRADIGARARATLARMAGDQHQRTLNFYRTRATGTADSAHTRLAAARLVGT